jgi:hypothetical protein
VDPSRRVGLVADAFLSNLTQQTNHPLTDRLDPPTVRMTLGKGGIMHEGTGFDKPRPTPTDPPGDASSPTLPVGTPSTPEVGQAHEPALQPPAETGEPEARKGARRVLVVGLAALAVAGGIGAFLLTRGGGPEIQTAQGPLLIQDVQFVDSHPAGCTPSQFDPSCLAAQPGYRLLVVTFVPEEPAEGFDDSGPSPDTGATYVTDASGERSEVAATSFSSDGSWKLIFTPATGATGFVLHHPGNEPIELDV